MKDFDAFKMPTSPALEAIRQIQENSAFSTAIKLETTGAFAAVKELQNTLNAIKLSTSGISSFVKIITK